MSSKWEFHEDVDPDDPLVKLRIPVVNSFQPRWKYVAAYLGTDPNAVEYMRTPPFASNLRPTDQEAQAIASFIREYITRWFNETYQDKLARRPLDVDSGCNTTVFVKYAEDDWGYRKVTWEYGPTFVPRPPHVRGKGIEPMNLVQVMDRIYSFGDEIMESWVGWKQNHPEVFS